MKARLCYRELNCDKSYRPSQLGDTQIVDWLLGPMQSRSCPIVPPLVQVFVRTFTPGPHVSAVEHSP